MPLRSSTNTSPQPPIKLLGFGLVELMVTIGVMLLVTAVILARHSAFNSAILLRNQAYSIAFSIRDAQQQAVSVVGASASFRLVYGVHFTEDSGRFPTFRDNDGNSFYESADDTIVNTGFTDPRFQVVALRTYNGPTATEHTNLSISFARPNFDARFKNSTTADPDGFIDADRAEIVLELTSSGAQRIIEVTTTGQISVRTP